MELQQLLAQHANLLAQISHPTQEKRLGQDGEQDHPLQQQPQILMVQLKSLAAVL